MPSEYKALQWPAAGQTTTLPPLTQHHHQQQQQQARRRRVDWAAKKSGRAHAGLPCSVTLCALRAATCRALQCVCARPTRSCASAWHTYPPRPCCGSSRYGAYKFIYALMNAAPTSAQPCTSTCTHTHTQTDTHAHKHGDTRTHKLMQARKQAHTRTRMHAHI